MLTFYESHNFALFPCNENKTPKVPSWQSSKYHIDIATASRLMDTDNYVGAWIPPDFVIIDLDRGHKDKEGKEKPDGVENFTQLCADLGISSNLPNETMAVKTGSGGIHLYFKTPKECDYHTLAQKAIVPSVDVKTHHGYVIASGTRGYNPLNECEPIEIPPELLSAIQKRAVEKAPPLSPDRQLSVKFLKRLLNKIPATDFNTSDSWQEFITSCIAVAGNSEEVVEVLEDWSRSDDNYKNDPSIRTRIESFEPDGGIKAGTFIYILKQQRLSEYLVNQVRTEVGARFTFSQGFSDSYEPPFSVDYSVLAEHKTVAEAMYYTKNPTAMIKLFVVLTNGNVIYSERSFNYFNGHRWVNVEGILHIIFSVLLQAGIRFYTDYSQKKDEDADDYINAYIGYISNIATAQRLESALKQHPDIVRNSVPWDSPDLHSTLTLEDTVMDFTGPAIEFRPGKREEYRRLYMDLTQSDFADESLPENFRSFLKDVFPDEETRKTATYALSTMISGTGKFRKFQIWNGAGSNGKSTLMELMKFIIGKRAISYKADVLLSKTSIPSLTPELAAFRGALVAFASETEESKRMSQGTVKALTGDETMSANPKYQNVIEFQTTFQLVLSTNYLPTFHAHDAAFIDRLLILPFYTCFYKTEEQRERSKMKGAKYFFEAKNSHEVVQAIKDERPRVLLYLAKRYKELNIDIPESKECRNAKRVYVDDNNDIVKFLQESVEFTTDPPNGMNWYFTPTRDLVNFYNEENNTKFSSKFVMMRTKEVFPLVEQASKVIDGKLTRGLKHIRIKHTAYPEGWQGNFAAGEQLEGEEF